MPTILMIVFGILTTALTLYGVDVWKHNGEDAYRVMGWFIIPVGALFIGLFSMSGIYLAGRLTNKRPTTFIYLYTLVAGCLAQFVIYFQEYLASGAGAHGIAFFDYVWQLLGRMQYTIGTSNADPAIPAGWYGYIMAVLQFVGCEIGAVLSPALLMIHPYCEKCSRFLKKKGKRNYVFPQWDPAVVFFKDVCASVADESKSIAFLQQHPSANEKTKPAKGSIKIGLALHGCVGCNKQTLEPGLEIYNGMQWKIAHSELIKRIHIPAGTCLNSAFRKQH